LWPIQFKISDVLVFFFNEKIVLRSVKTLGKIFGAQSALEVSLGKLGQAFSQKANVDDADE